MADENPSLSSYLELDDYLVWSCVGTLAESSDQGVSALARRLRDRLLYKCVDLGAIDHRFLDGNLTQILTVKLQNKPGLSVEYDAAVSELYTKYSYEKDPLKKILVKVNKDDSEPRDIIDESNLRGDEESVQINRAYVVDNKRRCALREIIGGL